jgi:hypothetical protein
MAFLWVARALSRQTSCQSLPPVGPLDENAVTKGKNRAFGLPIAATGTLTSLIMQIRLLSAARTRAESLCKLS